jgi:integral membrane protein
MILRPAPDVLPRAALIPSLAKELTALFTIKTFRFVAIAEATSFLVLLSCSLFARDGVPIMGPIHGMLFLGYVLIALMIREDARWDARQTVLVLLGAVLPFGGFVVDRWLARTGQLEAA